MVHQNEAPSALRSNLSGLNRFRTFLVRAIRSFALIASVILVCWGIYIGTQYLLIDILNVGPIDPHYKLNSVNAKLIDGVATSFVAWTTWGCLLIAGSAFLAAQSYFLRRRGTDRSAIKKALYRCVMLLALALPFLLSDLTILLYCPQIFQSFHGSCQWIDMSEFKNQTTRVFIVGIVPLLILGFIKLRAEFKDLEASQLKAPKS